MHLITPALCFRFINATASILCVIATARTYPPAFGTALANSYDLSSSSLQTVSNSPVKLPADANGLTDRELFDAMPHDDDHWHDAELLSAILYLRGNKHLVMPESWRASVDGCIAAMHATAPAPDA